MNKAQLIELVKINLSGGTVPGKYEGKYHDEVVEKAIAMVFNGIVAEISDTTILDQYIKVYPDVEVLFDATYQKKYINIPIALIQTPVGGNAIRSISTMLDQRDTFDIIDNHSQKAVFLLPSMAIMQTSTARIEGSRIYFDKIRDGIDKVLLKVLASFESLDDEDEIVLPAGQDAVIFESVKKILAEQKQTPQAVRNDNNPNTP